MLSMKDFFEDKVGILSLMGVGRLISADVGHTEALLRYDFQMRPEPPAATAQAPRAFPFQRPFNPLKHRLARFGNRRKTGGLTRRSDGKSLATRAVNPMGTGQLGREISQEKVDQPGSKTTARRTASGQSRLLVSFSALTVGAGLVYYFCAWG